MLVGSTVKAFAEPPWLDGCCAAAAPLSLAHVVVLTICPLLAFETPAASKLFNSVGSTDTNIAGANCRSGQIK